MTTAQKFLVAGVAAASLAAAMMEAAEARRARYAYYYYGYGPVYSYRPYGYYYGAERGYGRCQIEMEGHVGPKTCAYRR